MGNCLGFLAAPRTFRFHPLVEGHLFQSPAPCAVNRRVNKLLKNGLIRRCGNKFDSSHFWPLPRAVGRDASPAFNPKPEQTGLDFGSVMRKGEGRRESEQLDGLGHPKDRSNQRFENSWLAA